jgi:hypothetical protein
MRKHLITRILAGVATLAVAGGMAFASPASAEPKAGTQPAKKGCTNPEGGADLKDGTVWTSTITGGQIASQYKCNDGTWDKVENPKALAPTGGGSTSPTTPPRTATAARA